MKQKFMRFMQGRYGADSFSRFLLGSALFLLFFSLLVPRSRFNILALALLIYTYFRFFSRNISARQKENLLFLKYKNTLFSKFKNLKSEMKQRKTHHIYRCPNCHQKIRVPRGKGKIAIRCPRCNHEFIKKS